MTWQTVAVATFVVLMALGIPAVAIIWCRRILNRQDDESRKRLMEEHDQCQDK